MASAFFDNLVERELNTKGKDNNQVEYEVETFDTRKGSNAATVSFKFKKPVLDNDIDKHRPAILKGVQEELNARNLGIMDNLLARYGLAKRVGRKRTKGKVDVHIGRDVAEEGNLRGVQTVTGKMISNTNLTSLLELIAKGYLIKEMRRPGAPLKYRTGRFANSLDVRSVRITPGAASNKPNVSIFFSYMLYPYATFDPQKSNRPAMYMNPSLGARNPQKLIGEALAKAARDVIHARYKISTKQALL